MSIKFNDNLIVNCDTGMSISGTINEDIEAKGNKAFNTRKILEVMGTTDKTPSKKWWEKTWVQLLMLFSAIVSIIFGLIGFTGFF